MESEQPLEKLAGNTSFTLRVYGNFNIASLDPRHSSLIRGKQMAEYRISFNLHSDGNSLPKWMMNFRNY